MLEKIRQAVGFADYWVLLVHKTGNKPTVSRLMNFDALFDKVAEFLTARGAQVHRSDGRRLTQGELDEFENALALRLPAEYREYLSDLGNGFDFQYNWTWAPDKDAELFHWGLSFIEDVQIEREEAKEILDAIVSGHGADYGFRPSSSEEIEYARKRLQWLPISDIGGGGYVFSLDTSETPSPIRYQDVHYEATAPIESSMIVATSLTDWIQQWSRYCFSDPAPKGMPYSFTSFASSRPGLFDWAPHNFLPTLDRNANGA